MKKAAYQLHIVLFIIMFVFTNEYIFAQESTALDDSKFVIVEAEGFGSTKIEALNAAWSEAVKKAIGMYMISETNLINEDMHEKLLIYSRGRVNSYKELSAHKDENIWIVSIEAEIEKEVLIETINSSSQSEISIDGLNLAATMATDLDKESNKKLILQEFLEKLNFEDLFKINFQPTIENGQLIIIATIELDFNIYNDLILTNLNNILKQISITNENKHFTQEQAQCNKLLLNTVYNFDGENENLAFTCLKFERGNIYIPNDIRKVTVYDYNKYFVYTINEDLFNLIKDKYAQYVNINNPNFDMQILIEAVDDYNKVVASTTFEKEYLYALLGDAGSEYIDIRPGFENSRDGRFMRKITLNIPLDIESTALSSVTKIKGSLTFKGH
jgi:hypothetical protein